MERAVRKSSEEGGGGGDGSEGVEAAAEVWVGEGGGAAGGVQCQLVAH